MSKGFRFNGKFKWVIWRWLVQNGAVPGKKLSVLPKDEVLLQHLVWLDELLRSRAVAELGVDLESVKRGKKPKTTPEVPKAVKAQPDWNKSERERFFASDEWREIRYQVLTRDNGTCQLCGVTRKDGAILQVDHIKPASKYPALRLAISNLQTPKE